jgi:peptidoglycan/xylan/chitin deacetylase (PgdA/CDA1 family)
MTTLLRAVASAIAVGLAIGAAATPVLGHQTASPRPVPEATGMPRLSLPNEMGRIPILEYHSIGAEPEYEPGAQALRKGMMVRPATLRAQLHQMYAAGWYPVNMRDMLDAHVAVPAGRIPVVLTFDDARPSQFLYRKHGEIDPDSAVGILEAFHREHPDWPRRATFYVLPESQWNGVPFGQDGLEAKKLRFLVAAGYEVANHTTTHHMLRSMRAAQLRWEMANCQRYVRNLAPGATMDTMALPYGIGPRNAKLWSVLMDGQQGGTRYHNRCILLANGGPAYAPTDCRYNASRIPRIVSFPGRIERLIRQLRPGAPLAPFVSDGNPAIVTVAASDRRHLDLARLCGTHLVVRSDTTGKVRRELLR